MASENKQEENDIETSYSITNTTNKNRKRKLNDSADKPNVNQPSNDSQPPNKRQKLCKNKSQLQWKNILNGQKTSNKNASKRVTVCAK